MKFGILDFGIHHNDSNSMSTISEIIELVQYCEEIGISRYWLTEHHWDGLSWRNPEIIIALLAGHTERIKIGAAGVLLTLTTPYRVANDYKLLANLFPGRIDLGFSKGLTNPEKCIELTDGTDYLLKHKDFNDRILKVKHMLLNDPSYQTTLAYDHNVIPSLWVLGSSPGNFDFAQQNNFGFVLSLFHIADNEPNFELNDQTIGGLKLKLLNRNNDQQELCLAISVFCSDDPEHLDDMRRFQGGTARNIVGNEKTVMQILTQLETELNIKELIIYNLGRNIHEKKFLLTALQKHFLIKEPEYHT